MTDRVKVDIRPAQPVTGDGLAFARYLDTAADGAFGAMLGGRSDQIIAEAYLEPGHDMSFERVLVAELGGRIIGAASGYSAAEHEASSDEPLQRAAGRAVMVRMAVLMAIGRSLFRFLDTVPPGDFYLQSVAVDDDQRGNGVGAALLDAMEQRARNAGAQRLVLDVGEKNAAAQRLYERRGMKVDKESTRVLFLPGTRARRMVKTL